MSSRSAKKKYHFPNNILLLVFLSPAFLHAPPLIEKNVSLNTEVRANPEPEEDVTRVGKYKGAYQRASFAELRKKPNFGYCFTWSQYRTCQDGLTATKKEQKWQE